MDNNDGVEPRPDEVLPDPPASPKKAPRAPGRDELEREFGERMLGLVEGDTDIVDEGLMVVGWDIDYGHPAFVVRVGTGLYRVRIERLVR